MNDHHLSPARTPSASASAPRPRHGVVTPVRTQSVWRTPQQLSRLHQILALKTLGLPLSWIAVLLWGNFGSLDAILELQARVLDQAARSCRAEAIDLVRRSIGLVEELTDGLAEQGARRLERCHGRSRHCGQTADQ